MMIKSGIGLAAAVIAFGLCCTGAGWIALWLIRSNRAAVVSTLPVRSEQVVTVESPGELVVSIEVPRMSTEFRQWEVEILEGSTGRSHSMKWGGPRSTGTVTGISTVKIPIGRLTLSQPERLTVRVKGLSAEASQGASQLVLARPHLARMAFQIVGLVLCGVGMLLSLIWGLWLLGVVKAS